MVQTPLPLLFPKNELQNDGKGKEELKVGIARLASESPLRDQRNEVSYFDLPCRSVLNATDTPRMPFVYTINPYRGCEFGCTYCYARYTHTFMDLEDPFDFERKVYAKTDVGRVLARDLARRLPVVSGRCAPRARELIDTSGAGDGPGAEPPTQRWIAIGTATDPYQPIERRRFATREVLEELVKHSARRPEGEGLKVSVTTKSDLVLRDVDLLRELGRLGEVQVNVTITTVDRDLARKLEPRAPTPELRLRAVEGLVKAGIRAGVFAMPILPEITDAPRAIRRLVARSKEAGARFLAASILFLKPAAKARFMPWLEETFPELVPTYRRLYRGTYPPAAVVDRIRRIVEALRRQYRLPREDDERRRPEPPPRRSPRRSSERPSTGSGKPAAPPVEVPPPEAWPPAEPGQLRLFG